MRGDIALKVHCLGKCSISHFVCFSLTAVGYLCYLPDIHHLVSVHRHMPFQEDLLRMNPQCLSLLVLFTFVAAMMVKVSRTLMT
jgi:hypothetical protein